MSNLVFKVASPTAGLAIVRVFSRGSLFFSRQQERGIFLAAARLGIGPRCLAEFVNGRAEEFIPGAAVDARSMQLPRVAAAIAAALAEFHVALLSELRSIPQSCTALQARLEGGSPREDVSGTRVALWARLRRWVATAKEVAPAEAAALGLGGVEAELEAMAAAAGARGRAVADLCARSTAHETLSHLKWGLWGLIQAKLSDVTFDYDWYARVRLEKYHETKAALLPLAAA